MYNFILSMWVARKITETKVREYAAKGFITTQEADLIIATPQI
jgi:hypothetical protein